MRHELTNLLPTERIRMQRRGYFLRLATVGVSLLATVVIASGILLVPSYLLLHQDVESKKAQLADLDARLAAVGGDATNQRLAALAAQAAYLSRLATSTPTTVAVGKVLAGPHTGISLTAFSYVPPASGKEGTMTLTGTASTRETLRAYVQALGSLPFVSGADLPISAYAKETAIPFTITLSGSFTL